MFLGLSIGINAANVLSVPPWSLDTIAASIVSAHSLRKVVSSYAGASIRVRRSSDNVELDIGFSGNSLDETALLAHVGANSGYIVTWYDQKAANNLTQATTALQPRIVNAGTIQRISTTPNRAAAYFDGVTMHIESAAYLIGDALNMRASVFQLPVHYAVGSHTLLSNFDGGEPGLIATNSGIYVGDATGTLGYSNAIGQYSVNDSGVLIETYDFTNSQETNFFNGAAVTVTAASPGDVFVAYGLRIGGGGVGAGAHLTGAISCGEVINFNTALSDSDRNSLWLNQKAYYGTP